MGNLKRILNSPETSTFDRLRSACCRNNADVFAKVRVADVLPIENSGVSQTLYGFALRSHFDFVIGDADKRPLFAVEFDGAGHGVSVQVERDRKKDELCERFELPLLRVNSEYLNRTYRNLDLLTWFVECWFAKRAILEGQETGDLPLDECFEPQFSDRIPGLPGASPLWLSAEPLIAISKLYDARKCRDPVPSYAIGFDENQVCRGVAWLRIDDQQGVFANTAMRAQRFPVLESVAVHEVLMFQVHDLLMDVIDGPEPGMPLAEIDRRIRAFERYVSMTRSGRVCRPRP